MSSEILDVYKAHLEEQTGVNGVFTENAIYDPAGSSEIEITGIYENNTLRSSSDDGNVDRKTEGIRFILSEVLSFDVYDNVQIYFPYRNLTHTIQYVDVDKNGVNVLWLI